MAVEAERRTAKPSKPSAGSRDGGPKQAGKSRKRISANRKTLVAPVALPAQPNSPHSANPSRNPSRPVAPTTPQPHSPSEGEPCHSRVAPAVPVESSHPPGGADAWGGLVQCFALVVPPCQNSLFLADMSLRVLAAEISPLHGDFDLAHIEALLAVLAQLGLRKMADLAELPRAAMVERFGALGERARLLAEGIDDRRLPSRPDLCDLGEQMEFDPPAERVEMVAFAAKASAEVLVQRLARRGLDCVGVDVEVRCETGEISRVRWHHEFRFAAATIVDRVRRQLEGWYRSANPPTGPVEFLSIVPCETVPAVGRQLGMWGARPDADERAAKALARVQGLLGGAAVRVPRLFGGRRPADTGRFVPLNTVIVNSRRKSENRHRPASGHTGTSSHTATNSHTGTSSHTATSSHTGTSSHTATNSDGAPWPGRLPSPQPAVVLTEPEPVTVFDHSGASVSVGARGEASAAPHVVEFSDGRSCGIVAWAGPWPLDERWWHPRAHRRQARFQVVLDDGSAHLLVLEAKRWWREATYD